MARSRKTIRKFEDRRNRKKNPYTDIYGNPISDSHKLGYCHHKNHIGYLSHKLIVEHKCTQKECPFFHKYESHPFWQEKELRKKVKKDAKHRKNNRNVHT